MTIKVNTLAARQDSFWDREIAGFAHVHPLNAYGWGQVRSIDGWQPEYLVASRDSSTTGMMQVLCKPIPGTGLSVMYAPKGPVWNPDDEETLQSLLDAVRELGRRRRAVFLRIDPNLVEASFPPGSDPFERAGLQHLEHRWSFWNSPRDVYRIDLQHATNEDELFGTLDRDARRCVRKAAREGVVISAAETIEELHRFYAIFNQFSVDRHFLCRQLAYQEALWHHFIHKGQGRLFLAVYQGQIIGGLICIMFAGGCLAMHMGTPYKYHKLQTSYAYIWESLRWAKACGCLWYSFRGVGTTPTQESFKRKFQPRVVSLVGYYDLPLQRTLYHLMKFGEFEVLPRVWNGLMKGREWFRRLQPEQGRTQEKTHPIRSDCHVDAAD